MRQRMLLVASLWIAICPLAARGEGAGGTRPVTAYYYRAPGNTYYYTVAECVTLPPQVSTSAPSPPPHAIAAPMRSYAPRTAAPPSAERVPSAPAMTPPPQRKPTITESRPYHDTYAVARRETDPPPGPQAIVSVWNMSDRDMTLKIDGQPRLLKSQKNLRISVQRNFIWQVDGRDPQKENIAAGESEMEIVIRR